MVRLLIMSALVCAAPSTGQWVLKSGEVVDKPCPSTLQMSDKARLPQGCVAHQAGVWLSRKTYTEGELELVRLQQAVEASKAREAVLAQRVLDLETQLSITTVAGVCPACDCSSSIFTTTAIATGACAVWTLYNSQR
jgi:hypothetical protein